MDKFLNNIVERLTQVEFQIYCVGALLKSPKCCADETRRRRSTCFPFSIIQYPF